MHAIRLGLVPWESMVLVPFIRTRRLSEFACFDKTLTSLLDEQSSNEPFPNALDNYFNTKLKTTRGR
jgi:hypothetical protein